MVLEIIVCATCILVSILLIWCGVRIINKWKSFIGEDEIDTEPPYWKFEKEYYEIIYGKQKEEEEKVEED